MNLLQSAKRLPGRRRQLVQRKNTGPTLADKGTR